VIIAAILLLIGGVFGAVFGSIMVIVGGLSSLTGVLPFRDALAAWGGNLLVDGLTDLVIGVMEIVAAVGLFLVQPWAWVLAVAVTVVSVIGPLISIFSGHYAASIWLIVPAVILILLWSPDVRRAFGQTTA
jgi:hypothetical protein